MGRQYGAPRELPVTKSQTGRGRKDEQPKPKEEDPSPSADRVRQFHRNSDVDTRPEAQHHTLGPSPNQASPGPHTHDGSDSKKLLEGYTLTGAVASPSTVLPSIIAALVRLGAKDSTT